jgi:hypothetical protein
MVMASHSLSASDALPDSMPEASQTAAKIECRGYFALAEGKEFVSLARVGNSGRWIPVGGRFEDYRVGRLDRAGSAVVLLDASGTEHRVALELAVITTPAPEVNATNARVRLPMPPVSEARKGPGPAESEIVDVFPADGTIPSTEGLDWDWINSPDNPMLKMATLPSISETKKWSKFTAAERAELVELYRQCGWAISVFIKANGRVGARYRKIEQPGVPRPAPSSQAGQPRGALPRN